MLLVKLYGNELAELILYGSLARNNFREDSDVDFAVVLRNPNTRVFAETPKTSVIGSRPSLKYGLMISSLPTTLQKKETSMQGVYQAIRNEGVII